MGLITFRSATASNNMGHSRTSELVSTLLERNFDLLIIKINGKKLRRFEVCMTSLSVLPKNIDTPDVTN